MNERIKELVEETVKKSLLEFETSFVNVSIDTNGDDDYVCSIPTAFCEKFAELIIRECVAVVGHFEYGPDGEQGEFAMDVLRQHFGVE